MKEKKIRNQTLILFNNNNKTNNNYLEPIGLDCDLRLKRMDKDLHLAVVRLAHRTNCR